MTKSKVSDIRFDALRNAIYHSARKGFLDGLNRVLLLLVIAAGTTAVGDFGAEFGFGSSKIYAAIATLSGTLQLVFDFGGRARTHEFLQRQYYELLAKISETPNASEDETAKWEAELQRLYSEEPPPMRALDAIAYNAARESINPNEGKRAQVRWYHSLLSQFYAFNQSEFPWINTPKIH